MNFKTIDEELDNILSSCKTFAKEATDEPLERDLDEYGFLVSIGSNIGKIKKLIRNGTT